VVERKPQNLFLVGIEFLERFRGFSDVVVQLRGVAGLGPRLENAVVLEVDGPAGLGPPLAIDETTVRDGGDKRRLGTLVRIETPGVPPDLNKDFLHSVFEIVAEASEVAFGQPPDRAPVFIEARGDRACITGGNSWQELCAQSKFSEAADITKILARRKHLPTIVAEALRSPSLTDEERFLDDLAIGVRCVKQISLAFRGSYRLALHNPHARAVRLGGLEGPSKSNFSGVVTKSLDGRRRLRSLIFRWRREQSSFLVGRWPLAIGPLFFVGGG